MSIETALSPGLGSLLRLLLSALDGDVQSIYDDLAVPFRPRYFPVVRQLSEAGALTVTQLARRTGVSQPAITQTLNEMAKADLVVLETGSDRRAREVRLTVTGKAVCEQLAPVWDAVRGAEASLDAELSRPLRKVLQEALDRLAAQPFRERIGQAMK